MSEYLLASESQIEGYEGYYEISENGVVRGMSRIINSQKGFRRISPKILKSRVNNCGYIEVRLSKHGKTKTKFLHVLLAKTFIPNPENKPYVNHKNGIKTDIRLENLEWVSHSENIKHAYKLGLYNVKGKETEVIDIYSKMVFPSIRKAAEYNLIPYSTCKNYLNGNRVNNTSLRIVA